MLFLIFLPLFALLISEWVYDRIQQKLIKKIMQGDKMRKGILILVIALGITGLITGCKGKAEVDNKSWSYEKISAEEAKKKMESEEVVILDVRRQDEYDAGHIKDAILIPNETIGEEEIEGLDKDAVILVYCRSGRRSNEAAGKLAAAGYKNIFDFGGIKDWPYEVVKE